jgi:hypothetical protein
LTAARLKTMTVDEFMRLVEVEAEKFKEMWQEGQRADPKGYPKKLPDAAWWEQFLTHLGVL